MHQNLEKEVILPQVTVQLATIEWEGMGERPPYPGYSLFQRLSDHHSPLRIGNLSAPEVLPRRRSVGFLPPGRSIRLFPIEKPLRVLYCFYDAGFVERTTEIAREQWERHTDSLVALRSKRLEILMQEIYAELDQPGFAHGLLIEAVTTLMLIELARHARQLDRRRSRPGDSLALAPWQLRRVQERIRASPEMGYPALSELADLCGVSQGHLARSFKASTGWQIHKYIAEERLNTAKTMLAQVHLSCEEVSVRMGFKSPGYFSTAFRRMTGKTPTEFRRQALTSSVARPQ
jgi:AraC family transcriptional regulator